MYKFCELADRYKLAALFSIFTTYTVNQKVDDESLFQSPITKVKRKLTLFLTVPDLSAQNETKPASQSLASILTCVQSQNLTGQQHSPGSDGVGIFATAEVRSTKRRVSLAHPQDKALSSCDSASAKDR